MAEAAIQYFNRYTGRIETEKVYGNAFLRFTYGNPLGRLALHAMIKRAAFSRWYGWRMDRAASRAKVRPFIQEFSVDVREFADPPVSFRSFNEFFYRKLRPSARPVAPDRRTAVFPADGRHLGFSDISAIDAVFVKGQRFDLDTLIADRALADRYREGALVLSRLCPVDYHRFHFPVSGVPSAPQLINGPLCSVNPIALRQNLQYLIENKRWRCLVESPEFGNVLTFEVGATCVGATEYTFTAGQPVAKGAEKGFFKFGGSSTITLFEKGRIQLAPDLLENTKHQRELYARVGDAMGRTIP
ncbi:MAG: phosphatidylserine decarboxylase [Opitutaceae bacterium]|nr:phosphatidylserine decarboxylase [Verrucomicrobiales bacterium]